MSKGKILLLAFILLFLTLSALYVLNYRTPAQTTLANPPTNDNPTNDTDKPKSPVLVVPENPIGTIGMLTALMAGFGLFIITKKKKPL